MDMDRMKIQMDAVLKQFLGKDFDGAGFINEIKEDLSDVLSKDPKNILEPMKRGDFASILQNPQLQKLSEKIESRFENSIDKSKLEELVVLKNQNEIENEIEIDDIDIEKTIKNLVDKFSSLGIGDNEDIKKYLDDEKISNITEKLKEVSENGTEFDIAKIQEIMGEILPDQGNKLGGISKTLEAVQAAMEINRKGQEAKDRPVDSDEIRKRVELKKIINDQLYEFNKKRLPKKSRKIKKKYRKKK